MMLLLTALVVLFGRKLPALQLLRHRKEAAPLDVDAAARLMLIGVTAGLPLTAAIETAADELGSAEELRQVVRASRIHGVASALATATGPSDRLFRLLARAHMTGASTQGTIAAFIADRRTARRTATLERLRRLPVALTVPLTLLILPGFILLTLGPTVASIVRQLLGGLT
jgi:pilus assembly protein TadC